MTAVRFRDSAQRFRTRRRSIQAQFNRISHSDCPGPRIAGLSASSAPEMKTRLATIVLLAAYALSSHDGFAAPLSMQEAIAKVQRETSGKVLSAESKTQGHKTIYRIKVLTRDGQVKIVEVPAD